MLRASRCCPQFCSTCAQTVHEELQKSTTFAPPASRPRLVFKHFKQTACCKMNEFCIKKSTSPKLCKKPPSEGSSGREIHGLRFRLAKSQQLRANSFTC